MRMISFATTGKLGVARGRCHEHLLAAAPNLFDGGGPVTVGGQQVPRNPVAAQVRGVILKPSLNRPGFSGDSVS